MRKLVLSLEGVVIKEVQITKDRTTLGRRPFNDIVINDPAVSGEHAVLQMLGTTNVFVEDLNSTNGTYVNGSTVKKRLLLPNDTVELGKYKIKFLVGDGSNSVRKTNVLAEEPDAAHSGFGHTGDGLSSALTRPASMWVVNGATVQRVSAQDGFVAARQRSHEPVCAWRTDSSRHAGPDRPSSANAGSVALATNGRPDARVSRENQNAKL